MGIVAAAHKLASLITAALSEVVLPDGKLTTPSVIRIITFFAPGRALFCKSIRPLVIPADMFAAVAEVLAFVYRTQQQREASMWNDSRPMETHAA